MNLKNCLSSLLMLVLFTFIVSMTTSAATYYVNNNGGVDSRTGQNSNSGDNVNGPVGTITRAVQLANNGDNISIAYTGVPYTEPGPPGGVALLNKSVTLLVTGAGGSQLVINNVTINPGSGQSVTFSGAFTVQTILYLQSGTLAGGGNITMANASLIDVLSGNIDSAPVFAGTINLQYDANNTIAKEFPTTNNVVSNLNVTAGTLTINMPVQINGTLTATGNISLGANTLTLAATGALAHTVDGNITASSGSLIFNLAGSAGFTVSVDRSGAGTLTIPGVTLQAPNLNRVLTIAGANATNFAITGGVTNSGSGIINLPTGAIAAPANTANTPATITGDVNNNSNGEIFFGDYYLSINGSNGVINNGNFTVNANILGFIAFGNTGVRVVTIASNVSNAPVLTGTVPTATTYTGCGNISFGPVSIAGNVINSSNSQVGTATNTANLVDCGNIKFGDFTNSIGGQVQNNSTATVSGLTSGSAVAAIGDIEFANKLTEVDLNGGLTNSSSGFSGNIIINSGEVIFTARTSGVVKIGTAAVSQNLTNSSISTGNGNGNIDFNNASTGATWVYGTVSLAGTAGTGGIIFGAGALNTAAISITRNVTNAAIIVSGDGGVNTAHSLGSFSMSAANASFTIGLMTGAGSSISMTTANISAGTAVFGNGLSTAPVSISGNVAVSGGTLDFGTGTRNFNLGGVDANIAGASFSHSTNTTIVFSRNVSGQTLETGANTTWPGSLTVSNTFPVAPIFTFTSGNFTIGGTLTFTDNPSTTDGVSLTAGRIILTLGGTAFVNNEGYTSTTGVVTFGGIAAQVASGTGDFSAVECNNAAGLTFTSGATQTITGTLYLTSGTVSTGAASTLAFSSSSGNPTIVRSAGILNPAATVAFTTPVNVVYTGTAAIATGAEIPASATGLNSLSVSTAGGSQTVTLSSAVTVNGTLTVNASQTLAIGANNITMKGASIVDNGTITNTTGTIILSRTGGTAITGAGTMPPIVVTSGSGGNSISGSAGLTNGAGGVGTGSLTLSGGGSSGAITVAFSGNGPHVSTLTTGSGNTLTLGANFIVGGNLVIGASTVNLATFNLTFDGVTNTIDKGAGFTGTGSLVANPPAGGSTLDATGGGAFTVGNFVVNSSASGTITVALSQNMVVTGALSVTKGTLGITGGQSVTVTGNNITLAAGNDVTGTGALISSPASGTLTIGLAGNTTISTLSITGNTTLTSSASGTTTLTVTTLSHSTGLLTFGDYNINVNGSFSRTGSGTYSAGAGYLEISGGATFTQGSNFVIPNLQINSAVTVGSDQNFTVMNNLYLNNAVFTTTPGTTARLIIGVAGGSVPTIIVNGTGNLDAVPTFALGQANYAFPDQNVTVATTSKYWPTGNTSVAQNVTLDLSFPSPFKIVNGKENGKKLEFIGGIVHFTDSRTMNGNLTLTEGGLQLNNNVSLTLATAGSTISRTELGAISLNNGTLIAANVNIVYNNSDNNNPAAIGNTGAEFSSPTVVNNLTNNNAGVILNTARTIAGAMVLNGNTEVAKNITVTISITINGVTLTIDINITLTALGNVTMNGNSTTAGLGSLTLGGATTQTFTVPSAGIQVQNLNVNMTGTSPALTVSGGNVTVNGNLALTNGLVVVSNPNSIVLGGVQGYTKSAVNLSHIVGNVQRVLIAGALGRFEFPVGTLNTYRLVAITFNAPTLNATTLTISADSTNPGGSNGFPLTINGVTVDTTASFNWKINATPSFGPSQVFDVEFTGTGYTNYTSATVQNIRVVAKLGLVQSNPWVGQGGTYSNFEAIPGLPIVRVTNSTGNLITQTAIFTFGFKKPVTAVSIMGTVLYGNTPDVGVKNVVVTLNPGAQTVTTPAGGAFQFSNLAPGSYTLSAATTNAWLGANATDAFLVSSAYNGKVTFSPIQTLAGDVNLSGTDNNTDALLIVRRDAGLDNSFAAGDWVFTTANVTVAGSNVTQNLQGLVTGDVNGSDSTQVLGLPKALPTVTAVSGGALKVSPTKEFEVPVKVSSGMSLGAVSLRFSYPSNLVSFEGVSSGNFVTNDVNGKVTIAWADLSGGKQPINLNAGDVLLSLKFKPTANLKMGSQFSLTLDENSSELANEDGRVINNAGLNIASIEAAVPAAFALKQNYPNPFNPSTTIEYDLPNNGSVKLVVYNILGEQVSTIVNQVQTAGSYRVVWNASSVASGVYFYRITVDANGQQFTQIHRMMLLK